MADRGVDLSALPKEVRDQLAELDLELSEGKGGEGAHGLPGRGDALAHFRASDVLATGANEGLLEPYFQTVILLWLINI
ncbi:unnamed protein product [Tetraodon nigroviridis]|uniref:(spotted green pufferfish) hypothetical protein n=1 Tax=Tetraodon nigroviridis TaxID=99883 RepID=Q4RVW7_TETNG|nr:unnamed protein product [Tetraodon nigroviridis]